MIEDALLGGDERRQLGQDPAPPRRQIALALQHAGELCQVGLEPVLLGVRSGGSCRLSIIWLMVSLSAATSPRASTRMRAG